MKHEKIKIGALYPLTGGSASIGQSIRRALDFYVHIVNHQNQLPSCSTIELPDLNGNSIELIWADTQSNAMVAEAEVKRLVECEGVSSIIGCYNTAVAAPVSLQIEILNIPFVNPDTDASILTQRGLEWFFRTGPNTLIYTQSILDFLNENGLCNATFGSLAGDTILGQDEVTAIINLTKESGNRITSLEYYDDAVPVSRYQLLNIKQSDPDILFLPQNEASIVEAINISKEIRYCPLAFISQFSSFNTVELLCDAGKDVEYIISAASWTEGLVNDIPLARKVNQMYQCRYGESLNTNNALSLTGLYVLIDAIARAGCDNPNAIRNARRCTCIPGDKLIMPWRGVSFDENGQNIYAQSMVVQILGRTHKIVWPKCLAETRAVFHGNSCK